MFALALLAAAASAPTERPCPPRVGPGVVCSTMRDAQGAWVLFARPAKPNGVLIVHAHGGPRLSAPAADDPDEDLDRFAALVRAGYAWVGSSYRRGGFGVRMVDRSRALFWQFYGRPRLTLLHGQSWGGNIAAKLAETGVLDDEGAKLYDGVLITNGILAGAPQAYQFRADLRVIYQYYCRNHPAPGEPSYPLWRGLPADAPRMTRAELRQRVEACTGVDRAPAERSPAQRSALANILAVTGIAERQLVQHLAYATFTFRDIVMRLGGRNPFDNSATRYTGSTDDAALNAGVERFRADPEAVAALAFDTALSGRIVLPMLSLHAKGDPVVSARLDTGYAEQVAKAGNGRLLLTLFSDEADHSKLSDAEYVAVADALAAWATGDAKPDRAGIAARCQQYARADQGCFFADR